MAKKMAKRNRGKEPVPRWSDLEAALTGAQDTLEGLQALARLTWAKYGSYRNAECPADRIPTWEQWAAWLNDRRANYPDLFRTDKAEVVNVQWWFVGHHGQWLARPESDRGPHPLGKPMQDWQAVQAAPVDRVHMIVKREPDRLTPGGDYPLTLTRAPGALALATLAAVQVDGEPFVTRAPDGEKVRMRKRKVIEPEQGLLFPYPRTLSGEATAGIFMQTLADMAIEGDGRSPLRADLWRLGNLAYALTGSVWLPDSEGARLIGGKDSPQNRERFRQTVLAARGFIVLDKKTWEWYSLMDADRGPDGSARIGPPRWWTERPEGAPSMAFRLSGSLFVPASKWGTVERTVAGLEGALLWGRSPGRGRRGRLPDSVRPVRPGGPGQEVFIPAWQMLRLSGEPVTADSYTGDSTARERYRQRIAALEAAGYKSTETGTAHAGGTVEIVDVRKGGRNHPAGIVVRASARFCAAYQDGDEIRIPATQALPENR